MVDISRATTNVADLLPREVSAEIQAKTLDVIIGKKVVGIFLCEQHQVLRLFSFAVENIPQAGCIHADGIFQKAQGNVPILFKRRMVGQQTI